MSIYPVYQHLRTPSMIMLNLGDVLMLGSLGMPKDLLRRGNATALAYKSYVSESFIRSFTRSARQTDAVFVAQCNGHLDGFAVDHPTTQDGRALETSVHFRRRRLRVTPSSVLADWFFGRNLLPHHIIEPHRRRNCSSEVNSSEVKVKSSGRRKGHTRETCAVTTCGAPYIDAQRCREEPSQRCRDYFKNHPPHSTHAPSSPQRYGTAAELGMALGPLHEARAPRRQHGHGKKTKKARSSPLPSNKQKLFALKLQTVEPPSNMQWNASYTMQHRRAALGER